MGKHRDKSNKGDVSAPVKFFFTVGVLAVLLFIGIFIYHRLYMGPSSVVDEYVDAFMAKSPSRLFKVMNLEEAGLTKYSFIDYEPILIPREKLSYKLGSISEEDMESFGKL